MSKVFISYRRDDSSPWAGRICDRLGAAHGPHNVFMDVEDITPGADFAQAIENTVSSSDMVVAVIGPKWLQTLRARASGGRDFVEHEIATALRLGVTVVPVLVGGAAMPGEHELPPDLAPLARRQAVALRDSSFESDIRPLVASAKRSNSNRVVWLVIACGILIALSGSAYFLTRTKEGSSLDGTWIARMQRPGSRPYNIRLRLKTEGRDLRGQVEYPTGTGSLEEGVAHRDGTLSFLTRHTPQFESSPVAIRFAGRQKGREIDLTATGPDGGVTRGVARKSE